MKTIALYWSAYRALEQFVRVLIENGVTDDKMVSDYHAYKNGYKLARDEFLASIGL